MKRYLRELKPTEFEDIIAMVALYRPGPMEWIPDYISGKNGKKKVVYLHEKLQPILAKTYGVAIYQEQVMQIARALAGFSPGEADVLRKAMGKKIPALLAEQKEKFIDGCVKNGIYKELAEKVFSFIEPFAGYGFNRSHAACYAMIGYQTAYLKAHYPAEFMAALLTSDQGDTDRVAIEIEECRNMNIKITPPDINESFGTFTVVSSGTKDNKPIADNEKINTIRFGLRAVKNVGEHIVEEIIKERKANGPYRDIFDLLERVTNRDLNKKSMESLIKCGAFDSLGDRATFLLSLEKLLNYNKEVARDKDSNQASLFADSLTIDLPKITLSQASPIDQNEILSWEKELLGLYVSEHPYNIFRPYLEGYAVSVTRLKGRRGDNSIVSAGVISTIKKILTKKGEIMLFVKVEDSLMSVEFLVFPRTYKETESVWIPGQAVIVSGTISEKDSEVKFLVDKAMALDYASPGESVDAFKKMMFNSPPAKKRFSSYGNNGSTVNGSDGSWGAKKVVNNSKSLVPNGGNFRAVVTKINQDKQASNPESKENVQEIKKDDAEFNNVADVNDILQIIIKKDLSSADSENLKNIFLAFPGETLVYLMLVVEGKYRVVKTSFRVKNSEELIVKLEEFLVDKFEVLA